MIARLTRPRDQITKNGRATRITTPIEASSQRLSGTNRSRGRRCHAVDQRAEKPEHGKLGHRSDEGDNERGHDEPAHRPQEEAVGLQERAGRLFHRGGA